MVNAQAKFPVVLCCYNVATCKNASLFSRPAGALLQKNKVHVVGHHLAEDTFPKKIKAVKRDFLKHLNSTDFITFPWMSYISCQQVLQKIVW